MKLPRLAAFGFSADRQTFSIEFNRTDPDAMRLLEWALAAFAEEDERGPAQDSTDPRFS